MKKYLLSAICFLFLSSNAHALDLSRVKSWTALEILTAADLNGEFNNILNHSLTNNDIDAAAGIVGSKLNLSAPGIIGATTPAAATYTTLTINSTSIFKDKMSFTQTDNNEYIDSLADGYLDFEATTGLRWRINATEQVNLTDGILAPTTDDDIDLGSTTKEFKDLWIDGTANIDSLVADTADINAGTMDGVQIGGTTATGELIVNDATDDADGLGSQGTSGQFLQSAGAGANPTWANSPFTPNDIQVFTASGTWTKPANVTKVYVKVWGAGGGGGAGSGGAGAGGGGGGGGGYSEGYVTVTGNVTVTVGIGGAAGEDGGLSSFAGSATVQGNGGTQGSDASGGSGGSGGGGGSASGGQINLSGISGTSGVGNGGKGGSSVMGGGKGGHRGENNEDATHISGEIYGGGGGGAHKSSSAGAGANGLVIVYY